MPELIAEARAHKELRLWSAGCATGEEAYSLAILVADALGDELDSMSVRIFATDLDADAVSFARRGVFPESALTGLSPEQISKYFVQVEGGYEIAKIIRSLVVFGQHDLGQRAPFPRIDLLLCRNVLIYFTNELQKRALQVFAFSIRRDGYLVLGKAETVSSLPEAFSLTEPRLKVFRRIGNRVLIPPIHNREPRSSLFQPATHPARSRPSSAIASLQRTITARPRSFKEKAEGLLERLPVGIVVVDRRYDIELINGAARRFLGIHSSAIGEDFIHLVQNASLTPLRSAIDEAFRGQAPSGVYPVEITETVMGKLQYLEITCFSDRMDGKDLEQASVTILVSDATEAHRARLEQERLQELVARLTETNRQLLAANEELTSANARLRSSNEELLIANEEAQASAEEVETLNEEMQATNEELETLNEELQATVEELNTTNDDLQARGVEMHELMTSLEEQRRESEMEREKLSAILVSMSDAVLVVDQRGDIKLANAAYKEMFVDVEASPALETEPGKPIPEDATPRQRAARGETFSIEFMLESPDGNRRWFEATGAPLDPEQNQGGVVVIRDITDRSLRRLQDQFMAMASHELRTPLTALHASLQMIQRQLSGTERQPAVERYLSVATDQIHRMRGYIDDLMDVARLQSGTLALARRPVDMVDVTRRAVATAQLLAPAKEIALRSEGPAFVLGDDSRLEQVLLNLLNNAITHASEADRIDVCVRVQADDVEISVQDRGPGIPAEDLTHIFSRFAQLDRTRRGGSGGLGLGLYIANEIVTGHGGKIGVTADPAAGTTFTVHLPLIREDNAV